MITYREVLGIIKKAGRINGQQVAAVGTNGPRINGRAVTPAHSSLSAATPHNSPAPQATKPPAAASTRTSTRPGWVQVENGVWMPSQAAARVKSANPNVQAQTANEAYDPSARLREQKAFDKSMTFNRNTAPSRGLTRSTGNTLVSPGLARPVNYQTFNRITNYSPRSTWGRRY